jgi:2-keto-4-pentenoate hydratase/2-oxohepta-3-ene-1,7-dioic acid hydratase in catechol pathway
MNYLMHTVELHGSEYRPTSPVIFTKADSSLLKDGKPFFIPDDMGRIDYEGELVVRICRLGKSVPERFASRYYDAVTVGLDFTARDMQNEARKQGLPWTICKGFDGSAIIGEWLPLEGDVQKLNFRLDKNGTTVQDGHATDMLFSVNQLISYISNYFTLKTGDLLFTGTPAGVGPVAVGDLLEGYIENRRVLSCQCK